MLRRRARGFATALVFDSNGDLARDVEALAWAVRATARRVPRASCLTQALALETLLAEVGFDAQVRIGVARNPKGIFEAHAWLEHDDRVVIGDLPDLQRFAVLPAGSQLPDRL